MSEAFEGPAFRLTSDGDLVTVPVTVAAEGTVVRVAAAGVCGTDLTELRRRRAAPGSLPELALGHEVTGTVVHSDDGWPVGTRVVVDPAVHCGVCGPCAAGRTSYCERLWVLGGPDHPAGGLARFLAVPGTALLAVPPGVDPVAAALVEPLACAHHAASMVTGPGPASVLGAGTIGLGVALVLRAAGIEVHVVDPAPARARRAAALGLPVGRRGVPSPIVVDAAGTADAFADALDEVARGGQVLVAAQHRGTLTVDAEAAFAKELRLRWSLGALRGDFHAVLRLVVDGVLDPHRLAAPIAPADLDTRALGDMAAGRVDKLVVVWDDPHSS